jgi:hypothetical protein
MPASRYWTNNATPPWLACAFVSPSMPPPTHQARQQITACCLAVPRIRCTTNTKWTEPRILLDHESEKMLMVCCLHCRNRSLMLNRPPRKSGQFSCILDPRQACRTFILGFIVGGGVFVFRLRTITICWTKARGFSRQNNQTKHARVAAASQVIIMEEWEGRQVYSSSDSSLSSPEESSSPP